MQESINPEESFSSMPAPAPGGLRHNLRDFITMVVAVVVVAAVVGVLLMRVFSAVQTHAVTPSSNALVGHAAPNFTISTWNVPGKQSLSLSDLRGQPVVVNFWGSWCAPCADEAPVLAAAASKYQPMGVHFVGVAYETTLDSGKSFLRKYGITYPCGADGVGASAGSYNLTGVPVTVFIDKSGIVRARNDGPLTAQKIAKDIQPLLH